ncbi:methyltransferase domain-containing protein [Novosphingobium sp. ERN07]|uniref:class I SAM-dependent methyltransferase n=1 Tax=Novosphingobium sp. ERN07 TaxID=2726187 RepID=UPI0014576D35|nr:class I SAM-dependent methyltransferase [Novosphingobium sp. ERN07]NLR72748.1 methyltransferase domain-containing protein [Novosphingobium sp. ERN07]
MTTPYDRVAYPTTVFAQTNPERLAVLAHLAGLNPVPVQEARILEIGGGNCVNLIAMAAMWPGCDAHGFDLSETAIARGQEIVDASGLTNVTLAVEDICEAHHRYPAGAFDYVIAHGVYAWVPDHVREATMRLAAHVLSDRGVAFISYNAMPGGHVRMIMREMLLDAIGVIDDPDERIAAVRDFLEDYARARDGDEPLATTLRQQAGNMLQRPDAVLFHDELGPCFNPQRLLDVAAAAHANGLTFLTDAGRNRQLDGFLADGADMPDDPEGTVLLAASRDDYAALRYFRQSLFVKQVPDRRIDATRIADLWLSTKIRRQDDGTFVLGDDVITINDDGLADALTRAAAAYPQRVPISAMTGDPKLLRVILQLYTEWYVTLHPGPAPFPVVPAERPCSGALVRGMLDLGETTLCTLDHGVIKIEQPELRALLMAADGTRTVGEIAALDTGIPPEDTLAALTACCSKALMQA